MLPPAALAACSLAAGPSVLQPQPSLLSAEEETARRFDSAKCRRMLERVHASGWSNVCGFSRAGLNLGQHTCRAQPQQGCDIYYVRNEKVAPGSSPCELVQYSEQLWVHPERMARDAPCGVRDAA